MGRNARVSCLQVVIGSFDEAIDDRLLNQTTGYATKTIDKHGTHGLNVLLYSVHTFNYSYYVSMKSRLGFTLWIIHRWLTMLVSYFYHPKVYTLNQ